MSHPPIQSAATTPDAVKKLDTFLFAGGGTGGHLTPGLAVASQLPYFFGDCRIAFVGSSRSIERQLVKCAGYEHVELPVDSTDALRRNPFRFLYRQILAYRRAVRLLNESQPRAVVGLGGFASVPLVLAAARRSIPTIILEQNSIPGRATRFLSRFAAGACLADPRAGERITARCRAIVTGNPVRAEIAALAESHALTEFAAKADVNPVRPTLLILGGSQGAAGLNDVIRQMLADSSHDWSRMRFIHQTGSAQCDILREYYAQRGLEYVVEPFFNDMASLYRQATLVVSRAGATTLAELACAGLPAILIPFPHAADNHQYYNAERYRQAGAAELFLQKDNPAETAAGLAKTILALFDDRSKLETCGRAMRTLARPEAARTVATLLQSLTGAPI